FVTLDGAKSWTPLMNNLPATKSDDVIVHPRDQDLVLATHGRSFLVIDDISPLQQLREHVLAENEHLFRPRTAILWDEDKRTWHGGGDELFRAKNPPDAILSYYLKAAASGVVKLQVADSSGAVVRELDAPATPGIHRIAWDLRRAPTPAASGDRIAAGNYIVRMAVNGKTLTASLEVKADPNR